MAGKIPEPPRHRTAMATCLQTAAVAATWLGLVALATACFFAPRGAEAQPTMNDVVGFGGSMAIAGAAAAIAAFGIGGRRRWAIQLVLSVLFVGAIAALLLLYFLWLDPMVLRMRMDQWSFEEIRRAGPHWAEQLAGYHGPLGAAVGLALGVIAGLLARFRRRRPRLVLATALALLFLLASDLGRQFALGLVTWVGWRLRYHFVPWSISDDQISITGMIFGAIAGAVVASLAMYATRPRRGEDSMALHPAQPGQAPP